MTDLSCLVKAVQARLSREDLYWLRFAYGPIEDRGYDAVFDRVLERIRPEPPPRGDRFLRS